MLESSGFYLLQAGAHGLQLLRRMAAPVDELTHNAERLATTKRLRRVSREFLVGEVRVVFEVACRLDDANSRAAFTTGEFGSPGRGVECGAEVDIVHHPTLFDVGLTAGDQQLTWGGVRLGSVQVHARFVHLERHRLPLVAQDSDATKRHREGDLVSCLRVPQLEVADGDRPMSFPRWGRAGRNDGDALTVAHWSTGRVPTTCAHISGWVLPPIAGLETHDSIDGAGWYHPLALLTCHFRDQVEVRVVVE